MKILPPIKESTEDYEAIERAIKELFKKEVYLPLVREFAERSYTLRNAASSGLSEALRSGRVTFSRGSFSGRFNSTISKELKALGARFDRPSGTYKLGLKELPYDIRSVVSASDQRFAEKIAVVDRKLAEIVPEELAAKLKVSHLFDRALWKVEDDFQKSVKGITIAPKLTDLQSKRISAEWSQNMQLWIQDFTKKEITELRENMQKTVFSGNRYGSAVKAIESSYDVTANKAKFLARQETSLLMTKYKQTRYQAAGVQYYKWGCVSGTKNHPVRPMHKALEGKVFRWDQPPVVDQKGDRKNPGQDYNCRCFARPMVGYDPAKSAG